MMQTCSNCGASNNGKYCPECGQKQEHHKETFWHLITHFVSHYFHYDSKFWITLKTLCFSPGKLTMAYHNHQRMRYIPPVNLYIFVSVVFFLFFSHAFQIYVTIEGVDRIIVVHYNSGKDVEHHYQAKIYDYLQYEGDSIQNIAHEVIAQKKENDSTFKAMPFSFTKDYAFIAVNKFMLDYMYKYGIISGEDFFNDVANKFLHYLPKVFFLLMPLLALLLYMFFFGKLNYYFVDHGVMSLHIHCFFFISLMLPLMFSYLWLPDTYYTTLFFAYVLPGVYFLFACKKFYQRPWWYVLVLGSFTWSLYFFLVIAVTIGNLFFITAFL